MKLDYNYQSSPKFSLEVVKCFFSASFFVRFAYLYMISLYFKKYHSVPLILHVIRRYRIMIMEGGYAMEARRKRTKRGLEIEVDNCFPAPFEDVKLGISASPNVWKTLRYLYVEKTEVFLESLHRKFILPGFLESIANPTRGKHSKNWGLWKLYEKIKISAPRTFSLIDCCLKMPDQERPDTFNTLINEFDAERGSRAHSGKRLRPKAHELTAFALENKYGDQREKFNPESEAWTENADNFKRTYITPHKDLIKLYKRFIEVYLGGRLAPDIQLISEDPSLLSLLNPRKK